MIKHEKLTKVPITLGRFGIPHMIGLGFVLKPTLVRELMDLVVARIKATLNESPAPEAPVPEAAIAPAPEPQASEAVT
jgi:hypothetical protein